LFPLLLYYHNGSAEQMRGIIARRARSVYAPALAHKALLHASAVWRAKTLHKFKLADIGEGITECEVIRWYAFLHFCSDPHTGT
jgi:hypothetical protein